MQATNEIRRKKKNNNEILNQKQQGDKHGIRIHNHTLQANTSRRMNSEPKVCQQSNKFTKNRTAKGIFSPIKSKSPKIVINMQIKNLNIDGNNRLTSFIPKKKLHKKSASYLPIQKPPKNANQKKKNLIKQDKMQINYLNKASNKHRKTKSQPNLNTDVYFKPIDVTSKDNIVTKFASCNRKGQCIDDKQKMNQDTYIIKQNFLCKNRYLFGVFDGHGINGHYVAQFIREILPENIEFYFIKNKIVDLKDSHKMIIKSFQQGFSKTAQDLQSSGIDTIYSGTTTCLVYINNSNLYCSNLGDSRATVYSRIDQNWRCKQLSKDHKAENKSEAQRISQQGGRVFPYYDQNNEQIGPLRVWIKHKNIPGLAMTRSFGDFVASTVGVISDPELTHYKVAKDDKFMVLASDGLWQFISNEEVMNLVIPAFTHNNAEEAVSILEQAALKAWESQDGNIDDITIIVVFFKYY